MNNTKTNDKNTNANKKKQIINITNKKNDKTKQNNTNETQKISDEEE